MKPCPYCEPTWDHEHVGDTTLPLLLVVRDIAQRKDWHFHGTIEQSDRILAATQWGIYGNDKFEQLLLETHDVEKALKLFTYG